MSTPPAPYSLAKPRPPRRRRAACAFRRSSRSPRTGRDIATAIARAPGGHRRRRDRLRKDDPAPQDRARDGARPRDAGSASPSRAASPPPASPRASPASSGARSGRDVGYQIRFEDRTSPAHVREVHDRRDPPRRDPGRPLLRRVRHDHPRRGPRAEPQRSTFSSAGVKRLLPERPDLKVIVSSATLETERFSEFFGGAPVVQVEGRTYPGRRPLRAARRATSTSPDAVADAVDEVTSLDPRGDILVFLPGEREIREAETRSSPGTCAHTVLLPLYGAALRRPSRRGSSSTSRSGAWCSPPTSPRRRSRSPGSSTWSTPASRASTATIPRSGIDPPPGRAHLAGERRSAQGPLRARPRAGSASASTTSRASPRGPRSPIPRSSGRASPAPSSG